MTQRGLCSDCQFWKKADKQLTGDYVLGECHCPDWRCWIPQGSGDDNLTTEGDFGCVQFEARDAQ